MIERLMQCPHCLSSIFIDINEDDSFIKVNCPDCNEIIEYHYNLKEFKTTHKNRVKELVGKSLSSYHTKSLQQIDRINKKNKEQNHKINILTNELDNDYLTKTEEGSVISLEHSKEGMVYIDGLEGNTMVNYCADGSKEMTLNGDIDTEGTFVTTTEGVDGGLVDVMCEGETLVNLIPNKWINVIYETIQGMQCIKVTRLNMPQQNISTIKSGNTYTLVYNYKSTELVDGANKPFKRLHLTLQNNDGWAYDIPVKNFESNMNNFTQSISVFTTPTHIEFNSMNVSGALRDVDGTVWIKDILLLEGDWMNKEIPPYFEGMKSVGEGLDSLDIVGQNKNLAETTTSNIINFNVGKLKAGKTYSWKSTRNDSSIGYNLVLKDEKGITIKTLKGGCLDDFCTFTSPNDGTLFHNGFTAMTVTDIVLVEGVYTNDTMPSYIEPKQTKLQIPLTEPLRGLPNGVRDRFVKIGGKWFIERNCKQLKLTRDLRFTLRADIISNANPNYKWYQTTLITNYKKQSSASIICNKLSTVSQYESSSELDKYSYPCMAFSKTEIYNILSIKIEKTDENDFFNWIDNNDIQVIYELATPTYEPLPTSPELQTYTDTTHISNNSIIPCNMKIKNTGYNAIIKPSTLYTVALDTNKAVTVGMNLGGVKGTTANNVLTLTTPSVLTDDSLRISGKGTKGRKVRLLENDKTNWIPGHFEGMKSCFEDKLLEDSKYNYGFTSVNENITDVKTLLEPIKSFTGWCEPVPNDYKLTVNTRSPIYINCGTFKVKPNTDYILTIDVDDTGLTNAHRSYIEVFQSVQTTPVHHSYKDGKWIAKFKTNPKDTTCRFVYYIGGITHSNAYEIGDYVTYTNPILTEYRNDSPIQYIPTKSNSLNIPTLAPLRKWDKFVLRNGELMIERGSGEIVLDGSESWSYSTGGNYFVCFSANILDKIAVNSIMVSDKFSYSNLVHVNDLIVCGGQSEKLKLSNHKYKNSTDFKQWLQANPTKVVYQLAEPTYESIPHDLAKIILEGYENGTLFIDTNIPPTVTTTYAGETPIVKATKMNKALVSGNTSDINDNIIPYLCDMDFRIIMLEVNGAAGGASINRLFGGAFEMLQRDIGTKRYSAEEYRIRIDAYLSTNKITQEEYNKLGEMLNE